MAYKRENTWGFKLGAAMVAVGLLFMFERDELESLQTTLKIVLDVLKGKSDK